MSFGRRMLPPQAAEHTHDRKWAFTLGNGSSFCIGCAITSLDKDTVSTETKKMLLPNLLDCIRRHRQELATAFEQHHNVATGVLAVVLGTGLKSESRLSDMAFEVIILLLNLVKADEHVKTVMRKLCAWIEQEPKLETVQPVVRLMHQLILGFPCAVKAIQGSLGSAVQLVCRSIQQLKGPVQHEAIRCLTALVTPESARLFGESILRQIVHQTLALLHQSESDTILKEALDLLNVLITSKPAVDLLFHLSPDGNNSFPIIMKRLLLSAKASIYIAAIESLTKLLALDQTDTYGEQMLDADICEVLFEMLNTSDTKQCNLVCKCLCAFTEYKALYKRLHLLYGMEAIFQRCQDFLQRQQDTSSLFAFISVLLSRFRPDFGVPLFDSIRKISLLLDLLAQALASKNGSELLDLYMCFKDVFQHLGATTPWEAITECLRRASERLVLMQTTVKLAGSGVAAVTRSAMHQLPPLLWHSQELPPLSQGGSKSVAACFNALLGVYGGILQNVFRLLGECTLDGSRSAAPPTTAARDALLLASLQSFDECYLPQTLRAWREKPTGDLMLALYKTISVLLKLEHPTVSLLVKKLATSGFLMHSLIVKHLTMDPSSEPISEGLCELLVRLARFHGEDLSYLRASLLQGLDAISGPPHSLLSYIHGSSSESVMGAALVLLYYSYLEEDPGLQLEEMLYALSGAVQNVNTDWGINLKAMTFLSAIAWTKVAPHSRGCVSEELKAFWHGLAEVEPADWVTHHPALLEWSTEAVGSGSMPLDDTQNVTFSQYTTDAVPLAVFASWINRLKAAASSDSDLKQNTDYIHMICYFEKNINGLRIFLHLYESGSYQSQPSAELLAALLSDLKDSASNQGLIYDQLETMLSRCLLRLLNSGKHTSDDALYTIIVLWKSLTDLLQDRTPADEMGLTLINLSHYAISFLKECVTFQLALTCGNFIVVLISHSLHNRCQIVGLLFLRNIEAMDFLTKLLRHEDVPQRILGYALVACLLEFTCLFVLTPECHVIVDGEHAVELLRADSFPECLSGLVFWTTYFSATSTGNRTFVNLKQVQARSANGGRLMDMVLGDKEVRTMLIYLQQHLVKKHNILQWQASICVRNMVSYLKARSPYLAKRVLEQNWNYPVYQMCVRDRALFASTFHYTAMLASHHSNGREYPEALSEWMGMAEVLAAADKSNIAVVQQACQELGRHGVTADSRLAALYGNSLDASRVAGRKASPYVHVGAVVLHLPEPFLCTP